MFVFAPKLLQNRKHRIMIPVSKINCMGNNAGTILLMTNPKGFNYRQSFQTIIEYD